MKLQILATGMSFYITLKDLLDLSQVGARQQLWLQNWPLFLNVRSIEQTPHQYLCQVKIHTKMAKSEVGR